MTRTAPPVARGDRGVPRPARHPRRTPPRSPSREGGTPLVQLRVALRAHRRRGLAQGRGRQPDRLVQGPRHDHRHLGRRRTRARRPWSARRPATPRRRWRRTPRGPGSSRSCSCPRARSPPARWRRRSCTAPRSSWCAATSTTASQMAKGLAWDYPVALVNSVNPVRLEGQKTAAFEIVDFLGDAPDFHLLPVGNAGNISAYWMGYDAVRRPRPGHQEAGDARLPGRGRRAAGDRRAVPRPRDQGDRDPDRQPGLVEARRGRRATSPAAGSPPSATTRSWPPSASSPPATASSSSPPRRPGSPGCSRTSRRASRYAGSTVVITVTGHGLKDTATALEGFGQLVDTVVDADVTAAAARRRAGLSARGRPSSTARCGSRVPATSANLGPGLRLPRPGPRRCATSSTAEVTGAGLVVEVERRRRRRRAARRVAPRRPRDARGLRRRWAPSRPGCGSPARNVDPARPRPRLVVGRDRRRARRWPAALVAGGAAAARRRRRCSGSPPRSRATPTTSRRRSSAAS